MIKRLLALLMVLAALALALPCLGESEGENAALDETEALQPTPRDEFIDAIIEAGRQVYEQADGKWQRAHKKGDIYICKNFTVYVFKQAAPNFRMAEYPSVSLVIPNNMPADKCRPYGKGYCWEDVKPGKGNPFEMAAQFKYDDKLTKEENMEKALAFMRQVQKGDFFQMNAHYQWGTGPHSAIMIADYDPDTDTVHWMDSNMITKKTNGINYGKVQFNAEKDVAWWAEAFCSSKHGATIYRLRDDIIRK